MKEEGSSANGRLRETGLLFPVEHSLQKGLSSTAPAMWLEGPVHCNGTGAVRHGDTRGCAEANFVHLAVEAQWKNYKSPGTASVPGVGAPSRRYKFIPALMINQKKRYDCNMIKAAPNVI